MSKYYKGFTDAMKKYQKSENYKSYRRKYEAKYRKTEKYKIYRQRYYVSHKVDMLFKAWKKRRTAKGIITTIDDELRYWEKRHENTKSI